MAGMNAKRIVVEIERGGLLPVHDCAGATVACLQGDVWVTQDSDTADVVLSPGESLRLHKDGRTVVQALTDARVAVEAALVQRPLAVGAWPIRPTIRQI
jgi:quercetin dioxygenase-like cupin family protein